MIRTLSFNVGDVFCIASQLAWAFYSLASRKLTGHMDVLTALGWCSLCGTAGTAIYGIFSHTLILSPLPPVPFLSYLYITLFGGNCRQRLLEHRRQERRSQRQFRLFELHARHGNGGRVSYFCRSHWTAPDYRSRCDFCRGVSDDAWLILRGAKTSPL